MARRKQELEPSIQPREFRSIEEIDRAAAKLERRIKELEAVNVQDAALNHTAADDNAIHNLRSSILEIYGEHSPEYSRHEHIRMWAGPMFINMSRTGASAALPAIADLPGESLWGAEQSKLDDRYWDLTDVDLSLT